ncbi:phospholipid-transporting ATPase IF-like isoform X2 [Vespula pensylvanica]|uniref:phospholipid-transporting ATPase IF-like isoform X2 n=1 Tax=Vespula pensylvanica TaxID=30213 RepID=UPI001CB9F0F1|nr:phospholipid-transporting ATPase IF-like isoform X2 [Vespula pensylvanica]
MWSYANRSFFSRWKIERTKYLCLLGEASSIFTGHRIIKISPDNVPSKSQFPRNRIVSHKYTLWNFIPKNLFEQFRRIANFYFLLNTIVALSIESPILPLTSLLPLTFVILVTACKQGYEDYLRYRVDNSINKKLVTVIRNKCLQAIHCEQIVVGDIVKVGRDEDVPCDLLFLHSDESSGYCFVTTSNLDGETNLKSVHIPKIVSTMSLQEIASMQATVTCQTPMADLYTFHGKIEIKNNSNEVTTSGFLTIDNMLLRGAILRDTDYVIGCVIYTGQDTKLSLNSKIIPNKFSTVERSINKYLTVFIILLLFEISISTILKFIIESNSTWDDYLGEKRSTTPLSLLIDLLSFTILYNYIVPISLYVTIEVQKFLGSAFFKWDIDLYDKASDQAALSNTSDLNEELGQVEYLFTDKTGTLTENLMVFRRCSVNGQVYIEKDCDGNLYLLPPNGDEREAVKLQSWQSEIWHFMMSISLCHVVQIAPSSRKLTISTKRLEYRESFKSKKITKVNSSLLMHPDLPEYQATSTDEKALVEASARCGVIFHKDTRETMEIKINDNILIFTKMDILEFSSERKRMSVILKDTADDLWLYCKGADTSILPLIIEGDIETAAAHVEDFSMRGLRTLVVAYKKLSQRDYTELIRNIELARQVIGQDRGTRILRAYEEMESGLTLLGVTAVEDRLQEDVEETLECLKVAGIKVWILTGDKAETAENVAFLCGHFKKGTEILRLMTETTKQTCFLTLTDFERKMKLEPHKQYGFIINGSCLSLVIQTYPQLFKKIAMACESVVCCRLTPLQKSEIVQLIKNTKRTITAAVGDGGNDVSMIQEAHVGLGIMGREGRQAMMSSDFAIARFKHLKKVFLVHGHWYYRRISILTQYFFYKNFVFITPQVLFGIHNGFSTQGLYDSIFLMLFNAIFTSFPIVLFGLLEQNYSSSKLLHNPYLYKLHKKNFLLSWKQFILWFAMGTWQTCVIYFVLYVYVHNNPIILYDNTPVELWTYSTWILHMVIFIINCQILLCSSYWTLPFILSIILSELCFFMSAFLYSIINIQYDGDMLFVFPKLLLSGTFWLLTLVILVLSLIPGYFIRIYELYRANRILRKNEETPDTVHFVNSDNETATSYQLQGRNIKNILPWKEMDKKEILVTDDAIDKTESLQEFSLLFDCSQ